MLRIYIGKSAAGKDTALKEDLKKGFKPIISYTTRTKREKEIDGVDYNFVTGEQFMELIEKRKLLEYRKYTQIETLPSGSKREKISWYGTPYTEDLAKHDYVCVVDVQGAKEIAYYILNNDIDIDVEVFYIDVPLEERERRAREREPEKFDKVEWDRRAAADERDFNYENISELASLLPLRVISEYSEIEAEEIEEKNYSPICLEIGKGYFAYISKDEYHPKKGSNLCVEVYNIENNTLTLCGGGIKFLDRPFEEKFKTMEDAIPEALDFVYSLDYLNHLKESNSNKLPVADMKALSEYLGIENNEIEADEEYEM